MTTEPTPPVPAPTRCTCGALVSDHLVTMEGRCYLVRNARTLKLPGAQTLNEAFKRKDASR